LTPRWGARHVRNPKLFEIIDERGGLFVSVFVFFQIFDSLRNVDRSEGIQGGDPGT